MKNNPNSEPSPVAEPSAVPTSFFGYVKSMGPGLVAVLTWLGAGDIVNSATAGGNYGYALMWAFALCLIVRYLYVSIIAKYQLCNQHRESVLGGLTRLHPLFAPFIFVCTLILGHAVGAYMLAGAAGACAQLTRFDNARFWAAALCLAAFLVAGRPVYQRLEKVFYVLAGVLTVSLVGLAVWAGPSPAGIARGVFGFAVPKTVGRFDAIFIVLALMGAVGGGLANLMYPYFAREKGWSTPAHRRVQQYDLIFGIIVLIILDLSIWVLGAEVLYPKGLHISSLDDLSGLLGVSLGQFGVSLFYLGILAALFGPIVGNGAAFGYLAADAYFHFRPDVARKYGGAYKDHPVYRWVAAWVILSPLFWVLRGQSDFVGLTLVVSAAQVIIIPILVGGIWIITAKAKYIGAQYRNCWWENILVGFLFLVGCVSAYFSASKIIGKIASLIG